MFSVWFTPVACGETRKQQSSEFHGGVIREFYTYKKRQSIPSKLNLKNRLLLIPVHFLALSLNTRKMTSDAVGKLTQARPSFLFRSGCIALAVMATLAVLFLVFSPQQSALMTSAMNGGLSSVSQRHLLANPAAPWAGADMSKLPHMEVVSWSPRVFLYKNFLTDEECDYIIAKGKEKVTRSLVASKDDTKSDVRTSYGACDPVNYDIRRNNCMPLWLTGTCRLSGTFMSAGTDQTLLDIESRIALATNIPPSHFEAFYLLRYQIGEKYEAHNDYFDPRGEGMDRYIGNGNRWGKQ